MNTRLVSTNSNENDHLRVYDLDTKLITKVKVNDVHDAYFTPDGSEMWSSSSGFLDKPSDRMVIYDPIAKTVKEEIHLKGRYPFHTLKVCSKGKKSKGCFKTIQKAINAAKPGDTVKVPHGTWKEGVKIQGAKKRFLKLIGDVQHPESVVLEGKSLKGAAKSNGVLINKANEVTVLGLRGDRSEIEQWHVPRAAKAQVAEAILDVVGELRGGR